MDKNKVNDSNLSECALLAKYGMYRSEYETQDNGRGGYTPAYGLRLSLVIPYHRKRVYVHCEVVDQHSL